MIMRFFGLGKLTPVFFLAAALGGGAATSAEGPDVRRDAVVEAVQRVMPSVVNIRTETIVQRNDPYERLLQEFWGPIYKRRGPEKTVSLGSGVILDEDGWVLTNFHVVRRATSIFVKLADNREYEAEAISGTSFTDVALLKIKGKPGEKFHAIKFAADDDLLLGETVLALGNPFGLGGSVSRGILSSKSRRPPTENETLEVEDWLQTDAAINPGNSGGPLVNLRGDLIGIDVAVLQQGQGIGFAIPVRRVSTALSEIYSPELLRTNWFGARVRAGALPLVVGSVQLESPAGQAGLRAGDQILEVNGRAPRSFIDFSRELIDATTDKNISLLVRRGADERKLSVRLVREETFFNSELIRKKTGAAVKNLTPELARAFGLRLAEGVVIASVDPNSAAARAGLKTNMIITSVDGQITPTFVNVAKMLHARRKGEKATLDLVVPRPRGRFIEYQEAKVEVTVQ